MMIAEFSDKKNNSCLMLTCPGIGMDLLATSILQDKLSKKYKQNEGETNNNNN